MFETIFTCFKKENMLAELTAFMEKYTEGFVESKKNYTECLAMLQHELGDDAAVSVTALDEAVHDAICSDLVYSAFLGFKANLDYFNNPAGNNFLKIDPEDYLREGTAHRLPAYENAYRIINAFYAQLTPEQKEMTDPITDYESHLETTGPKLAHLWAFKKANEFFYSVVPGYCAPSAFTYVYESMMAKYMGITLNELLEINFESVFESSEGQLFANA